MLRRIYQFKAAGVAASAWLTAIYCGTFTGCTSPPPEAPPTASRAAQLPLLPAVTESPAEIKAEMKQLVPFSPQFEDARLKLLIAWEKIRQREGVEGFQATAPQLTNNSTACLDNASGQIAWRAVACFNPNCPGTGKGGGPLLFVRPYKNIVIGPDGKLAINGAESETEMSPQSFCPACGNAEYISAYELPESIVRDRQLNEEMQAIYDAYHRAEQSGIAVQLSGRTPTDVMTNKAELPKLFLAPEPGKVIEEGRLIVPASRGRGT